MAESTVTLSLPDGHSIEVPRGSTVLSAITTIGEGLARAAVAAKVDGDYQPFDEPLEEDARLEVVTKSSEEALDVLRHSTAHLMAYAIQELFPGAQFAFGPPVENGFYYDIKVDQPFSEQDLEKIEKRMRELAKQSFPIVRERIGRADALKRFGDQPFKVEQIEELAGQEIYAYHMGEFTDLCEGPHVPNTKSIKAFKLLSVAGAYWRGDENREQLQRIYGTSWFSKQDLDAYLKQLEEAKKRDHRKLGKELDLYSIQDEAGGGLAFYHPKGSVLRHVLIDFWKQEHLKHGYLMVETPHISRADLWRTSGHMDFYKENMYLFEIENQQYVVKPMNCPGHVLIYKRRLWSYRDLPVRYAEMGTVYRYERSGTLHGMLRVRGFTQDDAHIFCTPEQLEEEVLGVLRLTRHILTTFGFEEFHVELSVRDPQNKGKYAGSDEEWERAELSLVKAIEAEGLSYRRMEGEAVFYGPKIDVKLVDALGRKWQTSTCQFDFNLPRRFGVEYVDNQGERKNVYMVHRAIFGSLERFIGMLTEQFAGEFPLWLAPLQVAILPVNEQVLDYAKQLDAKLKGAGIRSQVDTRDEKIGRKIRDAELEKVRYMAVLGEREREAGTVSVRRHGEGDLGTRELEGFISALLDEIEAKR
ncbi:MAG TPA: threonine--tRNA ligase [Candidatus Krumholzibacteria bacterium]|nr:threonine--tRNA ligase [Candidatus Krumholzibacteria bacterium]